MKAVTSILLLAAWPLSACASSPEERSQDAFADFLQVPLSPDVQDLHFYDDPIGIDQKYQLAFRCSSNTAAQIISKHQMHPDSADVADKGGVGLQRSLDWWPKDNLEYLPRYVSNNDGRYFQFFWYDSTAQRGYYFDFDL